ncbi:conserved hypothetical protein [Clostridium neonatale]|nr:conserved hypothetical protein [Clostridium neonatale]CAI3645395.1 conserved hypothetical protein [Clostridium neonatale]CAI3650990.1 conserved hypothetical protein [Clostridium neonatale]CAI3659703.1 conserved hypothetical protein [Clostridium neonatale]CAI3665951.1 conserved hypothetical protein [Clostridium neonatale]
MQRKNVWALSPISLSLAILRSKKFPNLMPNLVSIASANGIIKTVTILISTALLSKVTVPPKNKNKYTGSNRICNNKLSGSMEAPNAIFPFAIPVNTRYQSVQGVTISITSPICKSTELLKNISPNR